MAKYKQDGNYIQLPRKVFNDPNFSQLPYQARWLYCVLCELEHRFTGGKNKRDYFIRSNEELAEDSGLSVSSVKRAKALLSPYIETWQTHWVTDKKSGKLSEKHVTAYRLKV